MLGNVKIHSLKFLSAANLYIQRSLGITDRTVEHARTDFAGGNLFSPSCMPTSGADMKVRLGTATVLRMRTEPVHLGLRIITIAHERRHPICSTDLQPNSNVISLFAPT